MASVNCPTLQTGSGDPVGVDYAVNGGSYVNQATQQPILPSDTHTKFAGGGGGDDGGISDSIGDALDSVGDVIGDVVVTLASNCSVM